MASSFRKHDWSLRPQTRLDESGSPDKTEPGDRICNPIAETRGYKYLIKPHCWPDLIYRPMPYTFTIHRTLTSYSFTRVFPFYRYNACDTLPGYGTMETKAQTCSRASCNRFLFRLSPCVNLFYCLLLFNHPMGSIPTEDTAIIGIWQRQTKLHVPRN